MIYKFFDKKTGSEMIVTSKKRSNLNKVLGQELRKPVIKKFKRRRLHARFKGDILGADLAEIESLSSENRSVKYFLRVIDVFTEYAWVKPLNDKKSKTILDGFIEIVNESNCKPNKLWVNQ